MVLDRLVEFPALESSRRACSQSREIGTTPFHGHLIAVALVIETEALQPLARPWRKN